MKKHNLISAMLCQALLLSAAVNAQPGSLDNTFSGDGKATTSMGIGDSRGKSVAIQSDGKIIVAGYADNGSNNDFAVARYNTDGSLDNTFDSDGRVKTTFGSSYEEIYSVAIQSDGKIIVAGGTLIGGIQYDFALARYNTNGSLDNTFDGDGKVTTAIGSADDKGYALAIQTDGKIIVAGYTINGTGADFAVVRYNTNGSLDNTFDGDGKATSSIGGSASLAYSLAIQTDGKIVVAGYSNNGSDDDFALARYNSNGSLDISFDGDGKVTTAFGSSYDYIYSVAIQSDGKIVVAGSAYNGSNNDFVVARYNTNGSLDNTFDSDGKVTTIIGGDEGSSSVAIQPDGKILAAGYSNNGSFSDFAVARYRTNGSLDNTFSFDGSVTTAFGSNDEAASSVAIQADGKIIVAGYAAGTSNRDFAVARYNGVCINTSSTYSVTACGSYTSPSGKYTWSTPGTYKDTVSNSIGCDSALTINLTIKNSTSSTNSVSVCNSYTSPSGNYTWTSSGTYKDTIPNVIGCDSVITINLTINSTSSTNSVSVCDSYTSPSGNYTWTNSGIYTDTIPNAIGCDSILTINLTIKSTTSSLTASACGNYIWNGNTYTSGGTFMDTIPNSAGCDSVMTLNLTIKNSTASTINPIACYSYTSPSGLVVTSSGTFNDTIPNAAGCDSVITVNLTINKADTSVTQTGNTLTANATVANYQWIDCSNGNSIIGGANGQSYTPSANGSYAVIVTQTGCADTSACLNVTTVGINEYGKSISLKIYPNPNTGTFVIKANEAGSYSVINSLGQTLKTIELNAANNYTTVITGLDAGMYFISNDKGAIQQKIVVVK